METWIVIEVPYSPGREESGGKNTDSFYLLIFVKTKAILQKKYSTQQFESTVNNIEYTHIKVFPTDGWDLMRDWMWFRTAVSHEIKNSSLTRVNF